MKSPLVDIDYNRLAKSFSKYVRLKASHSNSTIIYLKNGTIIEEDPKTNKKTIIKENASKGK